jgi:predicted RNA-binding protein with PIN domain
MLHVLIDGYNLMHKIYEVSDSTFGRDRDAFLIEMQRYAVSMSLQNRVTVYFDGKPGDYPASGLTRGQMDVRFTFDEEADDAIIAFVKRSSRPKDLLVVSDDRRVIDNTKQFGAQIQKSSDFAVCLTQLRPGSQVAKQSASAKLGGRDAAKVTQELSAYYAAKYKKA